MIELPTNNLIQPKLKSSKGNQLKWTINGKWYKADNNGYEGLSEYVVSHLLEYSNLDVKSFVKYNVEEIKYKDKIMLGCSSDNFMNKGESLITLQRLYDGMYGKDLRDVLDEIDDNREKAKYLVDSVQILTGIDNFGEYLLILLIIDAIFLNEDRHFHNIAFIESNGKFNLCPIFDNGAALLSDIRLDYPLNENEIKMISAVKSKTIIDDFDEQLNVMEQLYKVKIQFKFSDKDIIDIVNSASYYDEHIKNRIIRILIHQRQKYIEYFV